MKTALGLLALALAGLASAQTLQPRDIDHDGQVDAWYDPQRGLSWLADANAAAGSPFDNGSRGDDGRMTRNAALSWAAWVDVAGVGGWRLPTLVDLGSPGCTSGYAGTDCGYNVDTAGSEMAAMFHLVLGNRSAYDSSGQARPGSSGVDWGLVNAGPFLNLKNDAYWIGTPYPSPTVPMGWSFFTLDGRQVPFSHAAEMYAWAVHDGDVAPVPEPGAAWLLGAGLLALTARRRAGAAALLLVGAAAAQAGTWGATRVLEGPFGVSSPPESPLVVMNPQGQALLAWNATGRVRYADKRPGQPWGRSATVPGAGTGAGPVAAALGRNGVTAIAWTTVATRYVPSKLMVSLRLPGAGFGAATEVAPGTGVWQLAVGTACDGSVTLLWIDAQGVATARREGSGDGGTCNGVPAAQPWSGVQHLSAAAVGATLPSLAVNDAGAVLAAWQQGHAILAALRPAGGDWGTAQTVSAPTALETWNAKAALDAQGRPAVGFLDGNRMFVARGDAAGAWQAPVLVSGTQAVYYPALAGNAAGELVAAWLVLDAGNVGSIWQSSGGADGGWTAPARLSGLQEATAWPSVAVADDGSVALVAWVDQNTNTTRAAVRSSGGAWVRSTLGAGWWGGTVPVAAGAGTGMAGWAVPAPGNPNSATLVARPWQ